jgi:hypothetical protein
MVTASVEFRDFTLTTKDTMTDDRIPLVELLQRGRLSDPQTGTAPLGLRETWHSCFRRKLTSDYSAADTSYVQAVVHCPRERRILPGAGILSLNVAEGSPVAVCRSRNRSIAKRPRRARVTQSSESASA